MAYPAREIKAICLLYFPSLKAFQDELNPWNPIQWYQ
jgi:hypothetical protein